MPHYVPNKSQNIFGCNIFTEQISEYVCIPEIAQIRIQIVFKGHFIQIFKYLCSSLLEGLEGLTHASSKVYTGYFHA